MKKYFIWALACSGLWLSFFGSSNAQKIGNQLQIISPKQATPLKVIKTTEGATPKEISLIRDANRSYKIRNKHYKPLNQHQKAIQVGYASWYGPGFHGKKTASGEVYNQNAMTAAHKHLPLPSYIRVTRLSNGRSIIVKVNDRGPFHGERILDLSYAAAKKLGFVHQGNTKVKIETITPEEIRKLNKIQK